MFLEYHLCPSDDFVAQITTPSIHHSLTNRQYASRQHSHSQLQYSVWLKKGSAVFCKSTSMDLSPVKGPSHFLLSNSKYLSFWTLFRLSQSFTPNSLVWTFNFQHSYCLPCEFFALSVPASVPSAPALTITVMIGIINQYWWKYATQLSRSVTIFERYKIWQFWEQISRYVWFPRSMI